MCCDEKQSICGNTCMSMNVENPVRGASDGSIAFCRPHVVATTIQEEAERKQGEARFVG